MTVAFAIEKMIEFYKGNIKKVKSTEHKSSDLYIDLTNF